MGFENTQANYQRNIQIYYVDILIQVWVFFLRVFKIQDSYAPYYVLSDIEMHCALPFDVSRI